MRPIVWMSKSRAREACERLFEPMVVGSAEEFLAVQRDPKTSSFLDGTTIAALDQFAISHNSAPELRKLYTAVSVGPVIAVCDETLATAIGWLQPHPWLSHVVSAASLETKLADAYVPSNMTLGETNDLLDWLKPSAGRRVRLTHASRRGDRLERMSQFFASQGVDARTVAVLRDATDELLTNAFYEAPVAAGALSKRIDRSRDVALPEEFACDLAYGRRGELAIVRVRDPFGALSRERLVAALTRGACDPNPVARPSGNAEMGLWRVFSVASIVAVSVVATHHTEVLVAMPIRGRAPHPYAFHFFFKEVARRGFWKLIDEDTGNPDTTTSVTLTLME